MGERLNGIQEVRSSILLISTKVAYRATFFMPVLRNFDIKDGSVTKCSFPSVIIFSERM